MTQGVVFYTLEKNKRLKCKKYLLRPYNFFSSSILNGDKQRVSRKIHKINFPRIFNFFNQIFFVEKNVKFLNRFFT